MLLDLRCYLALLRAPECLCTNAHTAIWFQFCVQSPHVSQHGAAKGPQAATTVGMPCRNNVALWPSAPRISVLRPATWPKAASSACGGPMRHFDLVGRISCSVM